MTKTITSNGHEALFTLLAKARKDANLTQHEVAKRLRCHQSLIARIESGQRRIDVVEFIVICRALEVEPTEIMSAVKAVTPLEQGL
ncbi:helix-turn-helix transcriptional regulator [Aquicoccus sp. SU-CL01552]|uniref:helix-turn-helix domain-containing protein n=1 Tax=Aquicoccus sp. SU-CL01552 TaxID=3127656 RepID=UPI00310A7547